MEHGLINPFLSGINKKTCKLTAASTSSLFLCLSVLFCISPLMMSWSSPYLCSSIYFSILHYCIFVFWCIRVLYPIFHPSLLSLPSVGILLILSLLYLQLLYAFKGSYAYCSVKRHVSSECQKNREPKLERKQLGQSKGGIWLLCTETGEVKHHLSSKTVGRNQSNKYEVSKH